MSFVDEIEKTSRSLADDPAGTSLAPLREAGRERFLAEGLPTKRHEEWKYTPVRFLDEQPWPLAPAPGPEQLPAGVEEKVAALALDDAFVAVVVDGRFVASLSRTEGLPAGVMLASLSGGTLPAGVEPGGVASPEEGPFVALNAAVATDGAVLFVPAGVHLAKPVQILTLSATDKTAAWPRHQIVLAEGAAATVIETWADALPEGGDAFSGPVTEVDLAREAGLVHHTWSLGRPDAGHRIGSLHVRQATGSRLKAHTFWLGGRLNRHDLKARLVGEGAEALLYGLYVLGEQQHADNHTDIDHRIGHALSRQVYKGVLGGRSHGVFNGKVFFREGAQKSDTEQANHNLLLSEDAEIDTKPQLEIWADDVKASHGSTVGQLEEEAVFYLRSRGISEDDAQRMLTEAFCAEMLAEVDEASLRERLAPWVDAALLRALEREGSAS